MNSLVHCVCLLFVNYETVFETSLLMNGVQCSARARLATSLQCCCLPRLALCNRCVPPPQDILANIKGMSSGIRHPLRRTAAEALLARGPPEFDAGPGRIESSLGDMGPILPVVCGDAGVRVTPNE